LREERELETGGVEAAVRRQEEGKEEEAEEESDDDSDHIDQDVIRNVSDKS
jgi:hypothetical protein